MSVTPTLTVTTEDAKNRFTPDDRVCYFDEEFYFEFLPKELYRWEKYTLLHIHDNNDNSTNSNK